MIHTASDLMPVMHGGLGSGYALFVSSGHHIGPVTTLAVLPESLPGVV